MQFGGRGGDAVAALLRGAAIPGGDDTAGIDDQRDQRGDVHILETGLDDDIKMAGGKQAIAVAVEPIADDERPGEKPMTLFSCSWEPCRS